MLFRKKHMTTTDLIVPQALGRSINKSMQLLSGKNKRSSLVHLYVKITKIRAHHVNTLSIPCDKNEDQWSQF